MKIVKADDLSTLHQVFGWRGGDYLCVTVLAGFTLEDSPALLDEDDMWGRVSMALGREGVLDMSMPKPHGEALVLGKCFAPKGAKVTGATAFFRVGPVEKRVEVFGDRYWSSGRANLLRGKPEPFGEMDISWENAFGGPDYQWNPRGKGLVRVPDENGDLVLARPNIEDPSHLTTSPGDRPRPAGFGPMGLDWPARLKNLGTFDDQWFLEQWPGLPDDFDFSYYNLAPADQRIKGYFLGGEFIQIRGMHPDRHEILGRIPELRPRVFINRVQGRTDDFLEISMKPDTVYLIPHLEAGVLIWHGLKRTADDEAGDVTHLLAFHEPAGEPLKDTTYYESMVDRPAPEVIPLEPDKPEESLADKSGADGMIIKGLNTAGPGSKKQPPLEPPPPSGLTREAVLAAHAGHKSFSGLNLSGLDLSGCDLTGIDLSGCYLTGVNLSGSIFEDADFSHSNLTRARLEGLVMAGADFRGCLLCQATMKSASAQGVKMSGADLTGVLISGSDFTGADFRETVLVDADLSGNVFNQVCFSGSEGRGALANGSRFQNADLSRVNLCGAQLKSADLSGCLMERADLSRAGAEGICLEGAKGEQCNFHGADLTGSRAGQGTELKKADFSRAVLNGACWDESDLTGADLSGAELEKAQLSCCQLAGSNLTGARAVEADFSKSDFSNASLRALNLLGGSLRKARLTGADLTAANLYGVDFYKSIHGDTRLENANLDRTLFSAGRELLCPQ